MAFWFAPACRGAYALSFLLALFTASGAAWADPSRLKPWSGPAPAFALEDSTGAPLALSGNRAGLTIVHFFATWCEPCREELPALTRLAQRAPAGLRVISISVAEPDMRVRRFLQKIQTGFPVLLDRDRAVARAWGVETLPTSFVLDSQLAPLAAAQDSVDWDAFEPQTISATRNTSAQAR